MFIAKNSKELHLLPEMSNRHGLIAGSTGGGKTVTLQVIAENFSRIGVPVFMADIKGDLTGLELPGKATDRILDRVKTMGIDDFNFEGNPVKYWDIFGTNGNSIKTTITRMGKVLISRLLNLTDTQVATLYQIFKITSKKGIEIRNLEDLYTSAGYILEHVEDFEKDFGRLSKTSLGAIQRNLLMLEDEGDDVLFTSGNDVFDIKNFMAIENGKGVINILKAEKLINTPLLYATFLLWLLNELFEVLPERGDADKPLMVFFFDEAHLLFDDAPKVLLEKVERLVKLIRSKGVGIFFVTQNPRDIPDGVLSQLGNRVQHAMRAFTPKEQQAIRTIAQTFRCNPNLNVEKAIAELKIGEALVSFLDESGSPEIVKRALIAPPHSQIGC